MLLLHFSRVFPRTFPRPVIDVGIRIVMVRWWIARDGTDRTIVHACITMKIAFHPTFEQYYLSVVFYIIIIIILREPRTFYYAYTIR